MNRKILIIMLAVVLLAFTGCKSMQDEDSLYQVSTLQALIVGEYDGAISADTLDDYGDIGLGTFDGLDGEMIVIDGKVYKARVDGTVTEVDSKETIPFANVARINNSEETSLSFDGGYDGLKEELNQLFKEENMPVTFLITGEFKNIEYRSVPEQQKPYPALTEVVADQTIFFEENISGTLVGFRFPEFMNDMNAVGYHLHFISDDRTKGGHLLNVDSGDVKVLGEDLESFYVVFPDNLRDADLNVDQAAVEAVEKK